MLCMTECVLTTLAVLIRAVSVMPEHDLLVRLSLNVTLIAVEARAKEPDGFMMFLRSRVRLL